MDKFLEGARESFHSRKLARWILFTYPKTCSTIFVTIVGGLSYYTMIVATEDRKKLLSFQDAIYSKDNLTRHGKNAVIYNSSSNKD